MFERKFSALRRGCSTVAIALALTLAGAGAGHAETKPVVFDIAPKNTAKALLDYSKQSGIQLLFPYDDAAKFQAPALKGEFTREAALAKLLEGTNLEIAGTTEKTISIRVKSKSTAQSNDDAKDIVEVVVTGSHIRNAHPTSPIRLIGRAEIEQSGFSQIGDLMRSLPENFSGGQNPGVLGANSTNSANTNASNASTINLRGLGSDATLVLLNGHRLNNDALYQAADISGVPMAAIQRVEVLTDGASALYGADAVAGVVNFVLRKDFDGGEASARLGAATQGGAREQVYSVLQGKSWDDAYALINLEYANQTAVKAGERDFTAAAVPLTDLYSPYERTSLFVAAGRTLSERLKIGTDILYSQRDASQDLRYTATGPLYGSARRTPSLSLAAHAEYELAATWSLRLAGGAAESHNSIRNLTTSGTTTTVGISYYQNKTRYAELTLGGTLLPLPGGPLQAAFGAGYREDEFQVGHAGASNFLQPERSVSYGYGELQIPIVSPSSDRFGLNALSLSLAARYEDYSDFGTQTSPKVGFRYVPFKSLTIRGTWGESFKAPSFYSMYQAQVLYLYPASVLGYTGGGQALYTNGGNTDMKPERSESWTLGADFTPTRIENLKLSATWFNIDYSDRVVRPITSTVTALSNPTFAPFVTWSPSLAVQSGLVSRATTFYNTRNLVYDPASVVAVAYNNFANATSQTIKGADLSYRQAFPIGGGRLSLSLNGTWLTLDQQTVPTLPTARLSGTIYNQPEFKARGGFAWEQGGWSATGIVNYVKSIEDNGVTPSAKIASWTTVDGTVGYRFIDRKGPLGGVRIALAASNLFDRDPPYAYSTARTFSGFNYDSTNHSVMGRTVALTVTKSW